MTLQSMELWIYLRIRTSVTLVLLSILVEQKGIGSLILIRVYLKL